MAGERHAWQGVHGGGVHGRGCVWQGVCKPWGVQARGRGHAWQGGMCGGGARAWQEIRPLQRTVRILLECILVSHTHYQNVNNLI